VVIDWVIGISLAVIAVDALVSRTRLRLRARATYQSRRVNHNLGPEGWSRVDSVRQVFGRDAGDVGEIVPNDNLSRFDSLLSNNHRRGPAR
jgi:hypothetical protein